MSRYARFPVHQIQLQPIGLRGHDLAAETCRSLSDATPATVSPEIRQVADAIMAARAQGRPVILMMGGHLIKLGLSRFIIDLIDRGLVTHVASNGAALIHDFELSTIGGTSENVAKWVAQGQFGLWQETGELNDIIEEASQRGEGFGEAVGRIIEQRDSPHKELSIAAACWRKRIPFTAHVTIGGDIIHAHPNCRGSSLGQVTFDDFLIFANATLSLEGGVFLNVGSAITGPEVYLKALSMARNIAKQNGESIAHFTTVVLDMVNLGDDWRKGPPEKTHPLYYFRPWKTILHRTVKNGGRSHYIQGEFGCTIPMLWAATAG